MRHAGTLSKAPAGQPLAEIHVWPTLRLLFPYLWAYRLRVLAALGCLFAAKVASVSVPVVFKNMIDGFSVADQALALPALLLILYGALRFSTSLFTELREFLFARVTQRAVRQVALEVFRHLHALSLRFHLERQTGGMSRDVERGTRSISSLISYTLYSILPTLVEIGLVLGILFVKYDFGFVLITLVSLTAYIVFTVMVSNWRISIRRAVNESDSAANTRAVDSLLNYETVKYFNNEAYEARRYDEQMLHWEDAATRSQNTLSTLNLGQQLIIALGVTAMMWRAANGVVDGQMTIGDLVLVNAFLIQLYVPLNSLGLVYREIRQAKEIAGFADRTDHVVGAGFAGMRCDRQDIVPRFVKRRAHQVVHRRVDDGETLAIAGLEELDAGQQQAGVADQAAAGFEYHFEAAAGQLVEQRVQVGSHSRLHLVVLVLDAETAAEVKVVNPDAFRGQLVYKGQNALERLDERRWVEQLRADMAVDAGHFDVR